MRVSDLFEVKYGVNLELNKCELSDDKDAINFVSRVSVNNGVVAKVKRIEGVEPQKAGTISCAASGFGVLCSFIQTSPYYSGRDLYVLTPKYEMTFNEKLFYCMCLRANSYKYAWNRQANKTLKDIEIPDSIPSYVNEMKVLPIRTEISNTILEINPSNWKEFYIKDLFEIERGTRITKENRYEGKIPLVTAGFQNEGIADFIYSEVNKLYSNSITIDMFGNAFYREYYFYCDDNILVLKNQMNISKYTMLFIATIINADSYRFSYGKQYRQKDCRNHIIKLPVKSDASPDYEYMERYMKSLPYSDRI